MLPLTLTSYMDKDTAEAFAKVLEYIVNSLGEVVENNGASVLEYIGTLGEKIVAYKAGIAYIWIVVALIALVFGLACFIVSLIKKNDFIMFIAGISASIALALGIYHSYQLVECYTFPEKTIIEYVTEEYKSYNK